MTEDQEEYIADAKEMMGSGYEGNTVTDESSDKKYFIITPRIVKAFARNTYDFSLWDTVKDIAGEGGECYIATPELAILSRMSVGQVSISRAYWLKLGFLIGSVKRDPGYPQPVWHLRVPNLWKQNVLWCEKYPKISDRIEFIKSLHGVKASPGEKGTPPGELKNTNKDLSSYIYTDFTDMTPKQAGKVETLNLYKEAADFFPGSLIWEFVDKTICDHKLTFERINAAAKAWESRGFKRENVAGILEWAVNGIPSFRAASKQGKQTGKGTSLEDYVKQLEAAENEQ